MLRTLATRIRLGIMKTGKMTAMLKLKNEPNRYENKETK
jgi:hypothetical protein